jgi:hypothetical protein
LVNLPANNCTFVKNVAQLQIILWACALPSIFVNNGGPLCWTFGIWRTFGLLNFRKFCLITKDKTNLHKRMIKQLLNSVLAKYRDLLVARRSIICLCTDKSRYFAQPRPIIDNYYYYFYFRINQQYNDAC